MKCLIDTVHMGRNLVYHVNMHTKKMFGDYQCGFQQCKSAVDAIRIHTYILNEITEKAYEHNIKI